MENTNKTKTQTANPEYGVSAHYLDQSGVKYFRDQKKVGELSAKWNLHFWLSKINKNDSVLDFGCGGGYLLAAIPARRKVGVEINPAAKQEATSKGLEIYTSLDNVPNEQFSRVISSHALEHIPNPLIALHSMRRLLDPNGKLVLLLPLDDWRPEHQRNFHFGDPVFHLYNWTPQNIGNLLIEAGYYPEIVKVITDTMSPMALVKYILKIPALRIPLGWLASFILFRRQIWVQARLGDMNINGLS